PAGHTGRAPGRPRPDPRALAAPARAGPRGRGVDHRRRFQCAARFSRRVALADAGFTDAYGAIGGFTCKSHQVPQRIDLVWTSPELRARPMPLPDPAPDTGLPSDSEPSDHRALVAIVTGCTSRDPRSAPRPRGAP